MNQVYVKSEVFNRCRICLEEGSVAIYNDHFTDFNLSENICLFGGIDIREEDVYPKHLCESCLSALQTAVDFRKTAKETDMRLRASLTTYCSLQLEITPNDEDCEQSDSEVNFTEPSEKLQTQIDNTSFHKELKINDIKSEANWSTTKLENVSKDSVSSIKKELDRADVVLCKICNKSVLSYYWKYHSSIHEKSVDLREKCKVCNYEAANFSVLYAHVQSTHVKKADPNKHLPLSVDPNHIDGKVKKPINKNIQSQDNDNVQYNDKLVPSVYAKYFKPTDDPHRVECLICSKNILGKGRKDHYAMHDPKSANRFKCSTCKQGFRYSATYKNHKIDCGTVNQMNVTSNKQFNNPNKENVCNICSKKFKTRRNLVDHKFKIHGIRVKRLSMPKYKKYCKSVLINNMHMAQCLICHKTLKKNTFYSHFRWMHENFEKDKYLCDVCGKKFSRKMNYNIHMSTHSTEFNYKCKLCPYSGRNQGLLQSHMRTHVRKIYQCDICSKICHHKCNLIRHIRGHGEPRFECSLCGKKFHEKGHVKNHMNSIHLGRDRVHPCDKCDKVYASRKFMLKHQFKVHGRVKTSDTLGVHHRAHCRVELQNSQLFDSS